MEAWWMENEDPATPLPGRIGSVEKLCGRCFGLDKDWVKE